MSTATIDRGRPNLLMDHLQLGLRNGDPRPGSVGGADAPVAAPHFYLSLYVIPWSRDLGAGHVALLRHRWPHGRTEDMTLTDNPSLARAHQANLRSVGYSRVDLTSEPRSASFARNPLPEQDRIRYLISAPGVDIEARWDDLGEAMFAYGPAPQRPDSQRIWSVFFEAGSASAAVNGVPVPGHAYAVESWVEWLGRPLHSAHVARSEILVDNEPG